MSRETIQTDVVVVGAGLLGSSVAWHLGRLGARDVHVVDLDLEGSLSSSELNAGAVRGTFSQAANVQMSKLSIDFFESITDEIGFHQTGYLWLKRPDMMDAAARDADRLSALGWPVQKWDVAEIRRRVPIIDKTDDLSGAVFGERDGLLNPNLLKNYFRAQARGHGVVFEDRIEIRAAEVSSSGVVLRGVRWSAQPSVDTRMAVLAAGSVLGSDQALSQGGITCTEIEIRAQRVVNAAGAWAPRLASFLGYVCPSKAQRQRIALFDGRGLDLSGYGMIIDPSGVYFHPEATYGLSGLCVHDEPWGVNFEYDGDDFFQELIWPALYERSTQFENLRHKTGWSGQYEVSPDHSAIIGEVRIGAPRGTARVFESHSFSGHGAMHSYSAGKALAERMVLGGEKDIALEPFNGDRFDRGLLIPEGAVI